jgi:triacylglycerol lipase
MGIHAIEQPHPIWLLVNPVIDAPITAWDNFNIMTFLAGLLLILFKIAFWMVALAVLLSYTVSWYERANSRQELIEWRFTGRSLMLGMWLLIQETACLMATIVLRPLGWLPVKPPAPVSGARFPVILLHGLFHNRSCLFWLQSRIRAGGFRQIISINTPPWHDIESLTEVLAKKVDELRIRLKSDKIILVGHSMGGMIARNYVQNRGGADKVALVVTLGSPHHGSKLAPFAISPMGKTLLPGSAFLRQLNGLQLPQNTPFISIYTRHDNMVQPVDSSRVDGAENIELEGMGHTALLFHPRAVQAVIAALNRRTT